MHYTYKGTIKPYFKNRGRKSPERGVQKFLTECLAFLACEAKVTNAKPGGGNGDNVLGLMKYILIEFKSTSVTDDFGPPFIIFSCRHLLKDHTKFNLVIKSPSITLEPSRSKEFDDAEDIDPPSAEKFKIPKVRKDPKFDK